MKIVAGCQSVWLRSFQCNAHCMHNNDYIYFYEMIKIYVNV